MQYLCYKYTALQFILAVVVCLGGALLSIPLNKNTDKKKKKFTCENIKQITSVGKNDVNVFSLPTYTYKGSPKRDHTAQTTW